jgi:ferredoxin
MKKITQDHDGCIGCGACMAVCPDYWEMGDDGKANPIKGEGKYEFEVEDDAIACNQEAAEVCPVRVIEIE